MEGVFHIPAYVVANKVAPVCEEYHLNSVVPEVAVACKVALPLPQMEPFVIVVILALQSSITLKI